MCRKREVVFALIVRTPLGNSLFAKFQAAFATLPALRQLVQTFIRIAFVLAGRVTRMDCRFGLKRRLVAIIEWLRLCPNAGPLPHE